MLIGHLLDIDECSEGENKCDRAAWCKNTIGGYVCNCKEGYRKTEGGKCEGNEYCILIQFKGITKWLVKTDIILPSDFKLEALHCDKGHYVKTSSPDVFGTSNQCKASVYSEKYVRC